MGRRGREGHIDCRGSRHSPCHFSGRALNPAMEIRVKQPSSIFFPHLSTKIRIRPGRNGARRKLFVVVNDLISIVNHSCLSKMGLAKKDTSSLATTLNAEACVTGWRWVCFTSDRSYDLIKLCRTVFTWVLIVLQIAPNDFTFNIFSF